MKLKVRNRLQSIRESMHKSQIEFAEMLNLSQSAYQRLEKNETFADLEMLSRFSQALNVPIQEFLPETLSIHNSSQQGPGGVVFGSVNYHVYNGDQAVTFQQEIESLKKENMTLVEKIRLLEKQIELMQKLIG